VKIDDYIVTVMEERTTYIKYTVLSCEDKLTEFRWNNIRVFLVTRTVSGAGRPEVLAAGRRVEQGCAVWSREFLGVWLVVILVSA
jgi:hypothetical protein